MSSSAHSAASMWGRAGALDAYSFCLLPAGGLTMRFPDAGELFISTAAARNGDGARVVINSAMYPSRFVPGAN